MAINLNVEYSGRVTAPNADFPYGSSKNETSSGAGDGTPYEIARANDIFGFQQALLRSANIVPSGDADTALVSEYLQSVIELASGRAYNYDVTSSTNVYTLTIQTNQQAPSTLFDGQEFTFIVDTDNTSDATVDLVGLGGGDKDIINTSTGGELRTGARITLVYRSGSDDCEIKDAPFISTEQTITSAGLLNLAHGLVAKPSLIQLRLICKVTTASYSVGDEVILIIDHSNATVDGHGVAVYFDDDTNIGIRYGSQSSPFFVNNKATGATSGVTNSSWRMIVRAWL